ncbi:MAG: 23S rRNA (pseudouridine(1915)-N(3))-methyltransferase RlmH [Methylocystis sp.]
MRLGILCIGRMKTGPEREIFNRYAKRIEAMRNLGLDGLDVREFDESPARAIQARMAAEGDALLTALTPEAAAAVFDERGEAANSIDFARFIMRERDAGRKILWFVIGGAEGIDPRLRSRARAVFSFGAMTLPHQIVRILAAEQIYRAMTIASGHPYHRG